MEFAHLVHAVRSAARRRALPLLIFATLGTLLVAARHGLGSDVSDRATLVVRVDASATPADVQRQTDEAILLAFAIRSGFVHNDAAARDRLVRNVQFVDEGLSDEDALDEAIRLDMHRSDPVTRKRLIWLAKEALARAGDATSASVVPVVPTDNVLEAYLVAHAARFERAPALSFEQIFVSRERHGEDFEARLQRVAQIIGRGAEPGAGASLSDPSLLPERMAAASQARIDSRFGKGFAERLFALEGAVSKTGWSKPIKSAFGAHFIRITKRTPSRTPKLEEVRERVRHEYMTDTRGERVQDALSRLRAAYRVRVRGRVEEGT